MADVTPPSLHSVAIEAGIECELSRIIRESLRVKVHIETQVSVGTSTRTSNASMKNPIQIYRICTATLRWNAWITPYQNTAIATVTKRTDIKVFYGWRRVRAVDIAILVIMNTALGFAGMRRKAVYIEDDSTPRMAVELLLPS